ncbi:MAG: sigma-54-dependent Fis family transcriptional regulator [Flavobacteriales bacterium]|nr:sigma-54-dependent Fis family transcriptional regulator [Flavobacteriales bacterium]
MTTNPRSKKRLLVIDDDTDICALLARLLTSKGYEVATAGRGSTAMELLTMQPFDLVLCDHRLPDTDSMQLLGKIKQLDPSIAFIVITGYSDVRIAVELIRRGAFDYVVKPLFPDEIVLRVEEALALKNGSPGNTTPAPMAGKNAYVSGTGPHAVLIAEHIALVAPTSMSVLITGETGTGKEYVARAIHSGSTRAKMPFVAVDCGALPQDLAGSELFGHVKGAFTGSIADKKGSFELAQGGTLFLDEVGNLSYENQVRLLRVLQEHTIKRIGGEKEIAVDARIIAATHENLEKAVEQGRFREDLFHRIHEFTITLLPLRKRPQDIPLFAEHFRSLAEHQLNKTVTGFDAPAMERMVRHTWPGNLRELNNVVKRAVLLTKGPTIGLENLPTPIISGSAAMETALGTTVEPGSEGLRQASDLAEKRAIIEALERSRFNKTKAAEALNIDRKTLYNKLKVLGIDL